MNNKYIIFFYYEYNHKSNIINLDNKIEKLMNMTIYDKFYKFFSQLDSRRYYVISIYNPHIHKLIKILKFPLKIETIYKVLRNDNIEIKDKDGFVNINFDTYHKDNTSVLNTNYHQYENSHDSYNNYQFKKYESYFINKINIPKETLTLINNNNELVRIFGYNFNDTVPSNFQLTEDLIIYVSLKLY